MTGPSPIEIDTIKSFLCANFLLKDLINAKFFLGLELSRSSKGIYLSPHKYCLQILEDSSFLVAKPVSHPMASNLQLSTDNSGESLGY